jgi:general secretion pathway protein L
MTRKPKSNRLDRVTGALTATVAGSGTRGERFELLLPREWPAQPGPILWRWHRSRGAPQQGTAASLSDLPAGARNVRLHVWTPAVETVLLRTVLPTRSRRQILQALPYALEDQILDPPQSVHFAYVPDGADGLAVAVTSRERLKGWLAALGAAGLGPQSLAPVTLALPLENPAWTIAFTPDEIVVRTAEYAGLGFPRSDDPPVPMRAALAEARAAGSGPERILLLDPPDSLDEERWTAALGAPFETRPGGFFAGPAVTSPINLLQGEYAAHGEWRELARPYLPAAALLVLWLLGGAVADAVEWGRLWTAHRSNQDEMRELLLKSFPETKTVLDPAQQMQRGMEVLLARSGASLSHDFLPLLAKVAPVLASDKRVALQNLAYADRALTLAAAFPDEATLNATAERLRATQSDVLVQSVDRRPGQIDARIRVRASVSGFAKTGS